MISGNYPWYDVIDGESNIQQGDFIDNCPVLFPTLEFSEKDPAAKLMYYNVVIMSQSCDLENDKVDLVLVCPVFSMPEYAKENTYYAGRKGKEALRRGYLPGLHLLNKCAMEGFETDFLIVDFRNVYGIPISSLKSIASSRAKRLRLLPPYRENLSQAFARFFMRVGLPLNIPPFYSKPIELPEL